MKIFFLDGKFKEILETRSKIINGVKMESQEKINGLKLLTTDLKEYLEEKNKQKLIQEVNSDSEIMKSKILEKKGGKNGNRKS